MSKRKLYWVGSICGHVEPIGDETAYEVGDDEPCVHCPYPQCVATVGYVQTKAESRRVPTPVPPPGRTVMPKVNGKGFRCDCGCNVFTETGPYKYECNSCGATFSGEPSVPPPGQGTSYVAPVPCDTCGHRTHDAEDCPEKTFARMAAGAPPQETHGEALVTPESQTEGYGVESGNHCDDTCLKMRGCPKCRAVLGIAAYSPRRNRDERR